MTEPLIEARDLHVRLGQTHVLHGITLAVEPGEVVAILGANGSGKSTLIRALTGIVPPSAGIVRRPDPRRIGYVPQRVSAVGGLPSTAREVVAAGLLGSGRLRLPRDWKHRVHDALTQVGLEDRCHDATNHLSGGQQQRVLIARALVRHPDILILDEPVAGVDHSSQQQFAATMRNLIGQGLTVVVVLHELGELGPLVSRAVVLKHGRVIHDGAPPATEPPAGALTHGHHTANADTPFPGHEETGFVALDTAVTALTHHPEGGQ